MNAVPLSAIKIMNKISNTSLLPGDIFRPEMHLKQLEFMNSACGPFKRNQKKKKQTNKKQKKIKNQLKNFINQLLEDFKKEEFILHLKIMYGVLI